MPQIMRVVRCYKCETFQVDIEKQANKWRCKLCNEKQSLKKVYSSGAGKDCRKLVQELNELRLKKDNSLNERLELISNSAAVKSPAKFPPTNPTPAQSCSKWDQFIEKSIKISSDEDEIIHSSPPKKKARYLSKAAKGVENVGHLNTDCSQKPRTKQTFTKKALKRRLFASENEYNDHPLTKHAKKNNHDDTLDKIFTKDQPKTIIKSKWAQYLDDNKEHENNSQETKDAETESSIMKRKRTFDESNCADIPDSNAQNSQNWKLHTEWDSFSTPSPGSHREIEINDIIDDPFEEFENKAENPRSLELFSTVDNNTDLDSIFTL